MQFVNTHRSPIILNPTKRFQQKIYEHHLIGTNNHHQPSLLPPILLQHQLIIKNKATIIERRTVFILVPMFTVGWVNFIKITQTKSVVSEQKNLEL